MGDVAASVNTTAELEGNVGWGTYSGSLETAGDHDWIKVDLVQGAEVAIALSFLETGSETIGDAFLTIRNSQGNIVIVNDDGGVGNNAFLLFTASQTGTYYLDISEHDGRTGAYGLVVESGAQSTQLLTDNSDYHPGSPNGAILGGKGSDFINLGSATSAYGEQGNDIIFGNSASNAISGGIGNDTLYGGLGFDFLNGDAGDDILYGSQSGNFLRGGPGNDIIIGGDSADAIFGGPGKDYLTGGKLADTFVFSGTSDSKHATRDIITDFETDVDKISLIEIDAKPGGADNAFKFIGKVHFHHRAGELRIVLDTTHALTLVQGDVNGDGRADIEIQLTGVHVLHASDFSL